MAIPFVKKSYDDRASSGRLSDLIRMRGQVEADQIRQQGQQSAQMWSSLGQMAGGTLSGLAQLKYEEPRRQYEDARYQREMDDFNEEDEVDRILDEGGTPDEIATKLMGAGRVGRETAQQIQAGITKQTREKLELDKLNFEKTARNLNKVAGYFAEMETAPEEQRATLWESYRPKIQALVNEDPGEYSPDTFASKHQGLLQSIDPFKAREARTTKAPTAGSFEDYLRIFAQEQGQPPGTLTTRQMATAKQQFDAAGRAPLEPKKYPVTTTGPGGGPMQKLATEDEMIAGVPGYREPKAPPEPGLEGLTPGGLDMVAHQYAMTGLLPAMGSGKEAAGTRRQVINRSAEIYDNLDLPSQQAAYQANRQSFVKLQGQLDAITAFEETAAKNLDQFLTQAKQVVDTGSPLLNRPLRSLAANVLGDPKMAAFNTARSVVLPEYARIITNPNLAGVLSDSARQEVEKLITPDATLAQAVQAARILTQDAKNRKTSLQEQITAVRERIATPPTRREAVPVGAGGIGQPTGVITVTAPNGRRYDFKTQAEADAFKRDAGIR